MHFEFFLGAWDNGIFSIKLNLSFHRQKNLSPHYEINEFKYTPCLGILWIEVACFSDY